MKSALLLIDLQNDYLAAPGLQPAGARIAAYAASRLWHARKDNLPIIHVRTTVTRDPDNRMPHWKKQGKWICVTGTHGHQFAAGLEPLPGETVIDKQFFSGFADGTLEATLRQAGVEHIALVGVHLHACIRATALDAYTRGLSVTIDLAATGSDDPMHAAITKRYLEARGINFIGGPWRPLGLSGVFRVKVKADTRDEIARKATVLKESWLKRPPTTIDERAAKLLKVAELLETRLEDYARQICRDVFKPITMARAEVRRSAAILRATADQAHDTAGQTHRSGTLVRRVPLGMVAAITPWNNPLAIAVGKLAPAYLYDNAVLWKPADAGGLMARLFLETWRTAGADAVEIAYGYAEEAVLVANNPHIDAITVTCSEAAGLVFQDIALRRRMPFQAELGGNNAAIVAEDADIMRAARLIAEGAFGFAGQRCTANRRVVVMKSVLNATVEALAAATRALPLGDPTNEATIVGPLINVTKANELLFLKRRLEADGLTLMQPHVGSVKAEKFEEAEFSTPPTIVVCPDPAHEIVQEESFGPILVVQPADNFDHAMQLLNGVRQGLVAALFSNDKALQDRFLRDAQAGILKINQATADADAVSPFGGWKASGVGPAEHGIADREFFTRWQTIYVA